MASVVATRVNTILERQRARQESEPVAEEEQQHDDEENPAPSEQEPAGLVRSTITLEELEEERELARRRSGACVLLAVFILFRLWIEALQTGDFGLLLLCLVGTSWTARWIRFNRDREEELDRRIANYSENAETNEIDRHDVRMLSFQAQLALAILESQRHMMEGGYGGHHEENTPGVSDETRSSWTHFKYDHSESLDKAIAKAGYGSLSQKDDEGPHCSICLGEYETGEDLVLVPCKHIYHDECLTSWTTNHTKCPLCNYELEGDEESKGDSENGDNIV